MIINNSAGKKKDGTCSVFPIEFEEGSALANGSRQWSVGNGSVGAVNVVFPFEVELIAVSFDAEVGGAGTVSLNVMRDDVTAFTTKQMTIKDYENLVAPITFNAGQCVGFQTNTEVGAISDARAVAWFRVCDYDVKAKAYERFSLAAQVLNNVGSVLNTVTYAAADFSDPNFTLAGSNVTFQRAGCYEVSFMGDFFDNNSQRESHTAIFYINGVEVSRQSGANYLRGVSDHFEASGVYTDFLCVNVGDTLSIDLFSQSLNSGTTDLTVNSRLLIKEL